MNKAILENLSFGYEVEGMFKLGMSQFLSGGTFVSDSSVAGLIPPFICQCIPRQNICSNCIRNESLEIISYCTEHHAIYGREGSISTEYESQVYQNFNECLKDLGKFTSKNHIWNSSCGLHFHVGSKQSKRKLLAIASNLDFLNSLREEAKNWCACQKERLNNKDKENRFYGPYRSSRDLIDSTSGKSNQKYRMCRFHPTYNTLEFRFLCPCEHKVQNVIKLLNTLTAYLGRKEKIHREAVCETVNLLPLMEVNKKLSDSKQILNLNVKLAPGKSAALSRGNYGILPGYHYAIDNKGNSTQLDVIDWEKLEHSLNSFAIEYRENCERVGGVEARRQYREHILYNLNTYKEFINPEASGVNMLLYTATPSPNFYTPGIYSRGYGRSV